MIRRTTYAVTVRYYFPSELTSSDYGNQKLAAKGNYKTILSLSAGRISLLTRLLSSFMPCDCSSYVVLGLMIDVVLTALTFALFTFIIIHFFNTDVVF